MDTFYTLFWVYPLLFVVGVSVSIHNFRAWNRELAQTRREDFERERCRTIVEETSSPFAVLGLSMDASDERIRRRYHELCKRWHPDLAGERAVLDADEAGRRIREINAAYAAIVREREMRA